VRVTRLIASAVAVAFGLVVLLTYFIERLGDIDLRPVQVVFLNWAATLAAVALVVGILNLLRSHMAKVDAGGFGAVYSSVLIITFLGVLIVSFIPPGPGGPWASWAFQNLITPVEAALGGMIFFFLVFAGYRLLRIRGSLWSGLFLLVAVVVLAGLIPFNLPGAEGAAQGLADFHNWVVQVWAVAGTRGIILGVALGTIATGLRVLLAADRPYGE
jgi:hypothetical protein